MRKMILSMAAALALGMASCDSYLDINQNPNSPDPDEVTTDALLPAIEMNLAASYGDFLRIAGGFHSEIYAHLNTTSYYLDFSQFNMSSASSSSTYVQLYQRCLMNLKTVISKSAADEDWGTLLAATTLRVFVYQALVDCYGEIPYSEALQEEANLSPKYDDGHYIYNGIISEIDSALAKVSADDAVATNFLFPGQTAGVWMKFAKGLKLKLLMRMADVEGENVAQRAAALIAENDFPETDVAFRDCWSNETGQMSPFYAEDFTTDFGSNLSNIATNVAMTGSMIIRDEDGTVEYQDPRLEKFFTVNEDGEYKGSVSGTVYPATAVLTSWSRPVASYDMPVYLLTVAEIEFFKSEYYARYGLAADATAHYALAIEASFASAGAEGAAENVDRYPLDISNYRKSLGEAKWIALAGVNPFEAWCELRRLDYPIFGSARGEDFYSSGDDSSFDTSSYVPFTLYTPIQVFGQVGENRLLERYPYPVNSTASNSNAPQFPGYTVPVFWAE